MYSFFSHNPYFYPLDDPEIRGKIYGHVAKALTSDRKLLKKIKMYFDPVDFEILRNYAKKNRLERVVYTSNYMVIYLKRNVQDSRVIVIGYDRSRGKLFVNLCFRSIEIFENDDPVGIDQLVRQRIFGYDEDVDVDEYVISTDRVMNYRVQGDLVISVTPLLNRDVLETYVNMLIHSMPFYRSYARYVIFKIHTLLNNLRINHRIENDGRVITIDRTLYKYSKSYVDNLDKLLKLLRKIMCDHIGDLCEYLAIEHYVSDGWGNQYKRIEIAVNNVNYNSGLVNEIKKLIVENVEKEHYVVYHGNHRIEIDQAYPRSIRVIYDDHEFTGSIDQIFVDQDSIITITHDQHGKVILRFDRPCVIEFRSTSTSWDHDLIFTMYSIKHLLKKYDSNF